MSVTFTHRDDCETTGNGRLARRTLGLEAFGINLVDIPPGGQIHEHDEIEREQEEVFCVLSGTSTLVLEREYHPARAGCVARLDPEHRRTVRNDGDAPASVLIASAPRSGGYQPMEWN